MPEPVVNATEFGAPFRTEWLVLRMVTADDVDDIVRYQGDPEVILEEEWAARR